MPLSQLLEQFRKAARTSLVEEADGKVIGYLTMEDVLEVLVGDIQDEHRKAERGILAYQPGKLLVRGDTPLFKVERLLVSTWTTSKRKPSPGWSTTPSNACRKKKKCWKSKACGSSSRR
jgi:CBS domain containing-hemolysin-like protein